MTILKAATSPLEDLDEFLELFGSLVRRPESRHAMERYTTGLLTDLRRKTASDIGRAVAGTNAQRLQEFLTRTAWDPQEMDRLRIGHMMSRASVGEGVQIVHDTGFAKKGSHSVGVARQYSGTLGRVDNCQVLVTTHYVDRVFDWPLTSRVYLPLSWVQDSARRAAAEVPTQVRFQTKGEIALRLIDAGMDAGVRTRAVVADAGYGDQPPFLDGLEDRRLPYVVGVPSIARFHIAEEVDQYPGDEPPPPYQGIGRPRKAKRLEDRIPGRDASSILEGLEQDSWRIVAWRKGTKGVLRKRCARIRVCRVGYRGTHLSSVGWLIGECPVGGHQGETKYYLAWGVDQMSLGDIVELAHSRWIIERFYQDAKGEVGLDDYAGRLWSGFHRHVALAMLAHSYLAIRQDYEPDIAEHTYPDNGQEHRPTEPPGPTRGFPPTAASEPGLAQTTGSRATVRSGD